MDEGTFKRRSTNRNMGYASTRYKQLKLDGKHYLVHRLAYYYVTGLDPGDMMVDHIDGDCFNNRIENLQLVTNQQNQHKSKVCNNNPKTINGTWTQYGREWNRKRMQGIKQGLQH